MSLLSAALEKQVTSRLREKGLVVWLDPKAYYSTFVDQLADRDFFAPIVAFRGSFLETLVQLEPYQRKRDPEPLLIHVPGHSDQSIRKTPLLESYRAGTRLQVGLDTLVREVAAGRVASDATEDFLKKGTNLEAAEAWLQGLLSSAREGLAGYLDPLLPEWVLDSLLKRDSELSRRVQDRQDLQDLREYLNRYTGLSEAFEGFYLQGQAQDRGELTDACVGWLLSVEYVFDLVRAPALEILKPLKSLSTPLRKTCQQLAAHLRERHRGVYCEQALQAEGLLEAELEAGSPDELGKIDTFSREDSRLLEAAARHLGDESWKQALDWANSRLESPSVWLERDVSRRQEWLLIQSAARLGQELVSAAEPLKGVTSLEEALDRYTGGAQLVDRAHRHFEQERMQLLTPQLPHFTLLAQVTSVLRRRYRAWVDRLCDHFAELCSSQGYLPSPLFQQRYLYEHVVHPLTQASEGTVAYFMVDALRFEMASELAAQLEEQAATVRLGARYAELPSVTPVGMNALAPVSRDGKLTLDNTPFQGFRAKEYSVQNPESRVRAMSERSLKGHSGSRQAAVRLDLHDVSNLAPEQLRRQVKNAALVVVHSREIDNLGEADLGLHTFDRWIGQLRLAVHHLRNAGVEEFVIVSDHGFLLQDETCVPLTYTAQNMDRRFVLHDGPVDEPGTTSVALHALGYGGYDGHLMFLRDTRAFKRKAQNAATFVHGGNSLQERVIPVLTVSYRKAPKPIRVSYKLQAEALSPVLHLSRLRLRLDREDKTQGLLEFEKSRPVPLALRVPDAEVQVIIQDAPGVSIVNQQLHVQPDQWFEVFFTLEGSVAARAAVEVYHPDGGKQIAAKRIPEHFEVRGGAPVSVLIDSPVSNAWEQAFEDEKVLRVFIHLQKHGAIVEAELIGMLGSAREARKFALNFDRFRALVPFTVTMDSGSSGKRYVRG